MRLEDLCLERASSFLELLKKNGLYVATAESCTGGALANFLTSIENASQAFTDGFITYCNESKIALGVPSEVIDRYSVYSKETAIAMAEAARASATRADLGIGITGTLTNEDCNNPNSNPGTVYIGFSGDNYKEALEFGFDPRVGRWESKNRIVLKTLERAEDLISSRLTLSQ